MLRETMGTIFQGELAEGHHAVTLINWEYKAHATDASKDYIIATFKHELGTYKRNMFDKDITIMLSHLRRQLGRSTESINPAEFLNDLIATVTPFSIWISYPTVPTANGERRVQNLHFLEPYGKIEEATAGADDMEVPA